MYYTEIQHHHVRQQIYNFFKRKGKKKTHVYTHREGGQWETVDKGWLGMPALKLWVSLSRSS